MDDPELIDSAGDVLTWYGQVLKRGNKRPVDELDCAGEILSACAGAALYRHDLLQDVGGFDEEFSSYIEDIDLGLRGRLSGYTCVYVPNAEVLHKGHGSNIPPRKYVRLVTRNRLMLLGKNIPLRLLVRHLHHIFIGQLVLSIQYGRPVDSIIGYLSLIPRIPYVIRERRRILTGKMLTEKDIDGLLLLSPEGISLPGWYSSTKEKKRQ